VPLENLIVAQLVKFLTLYGTRVHKSSPLHVVLSQMNPGHTLTTFASYLRLVLPISLYRSGSQPKYLYAFLISLMRVAYPANHISLDVITNYETSHYAMFSILHQLPLSYM